MTVALPILSACGHETCILPTAMLSTHTGGFGKPAVIHLADSLDAFRKHWQQNGITFDAILVGYLGSVQAIELAGKIMDQMLSPNGIAIVDPAMADHGKLYSGFDGDYALAMTDLCRKAHIVIPNITEAAILCGKPYQAELSREYVEELLDGLEYDNVILTGVGYAAGETGVAIRAGKQRYHYAHHRTEQSHHGTGDIFAAAFTGALLQDKPMYDAIKIAAEFTRRSIENTEKAPAHWYGVKFETALPDLMAMLRKE